MIFKTEKSDSEKRTLEKIYVALILTQLYVPPDTEHPILLFMFRINQILNWKM